MGYVDQIAVAKAIAMDAHAGQFDKLGQPYIDHPRRVAARVRSITGEAVAWLHDVVEDTPVTLDLLRSEGLYPTVVDAVDAITHRKAEPRVEYYERVKSNPFALTVKLADIADNTDPRRLVSLDAQTLYRLLKKYALALDALSEPLRALGGSEYTKTED